MRTPEGIVLAGEIWAETGDKSPPAFSITGGYPLTMSQPVTFAILASGTITATVGDFIALAATSFGRCTVDGNTQEFNLDFTSVTTFDEIATEFQTKMVAATLPVTVTFDVLTTSLLIRSNTAGVTSTISFFLVPGGGTNIAPTAKLRLIDGATTTQGQGEFPPREVFNNNQNINTALGFDVNRYGANLAWDTIIPYLQGSVVIEQGKRFQALKDNQGVNPINNSGQATNTSIAGGDKIIHVGVDASDNIRLTTKTGKVYKSTDGGDNFIQTGSLTLDLQNLTQSHVGGTTEQWIVVNQNSPNLNVALISDDDGVTFQTLGTFFSFADLDTKFDEIIIANTFLFNNSNFTHIGFARVDSTDELFIVLLDATTAQARIIDTTVISLNQFDVHNFWLTDDFFYFTTIEGLTDNEITRLHQIEIKSTFTPGTIETPQATDDILISTPDVGDTFGGTSALILGDNGEIWIAARAGGGTVFGDGSIIWFIDVQTNNFATITLKFISENSNIPIDFNGSTFSFVKGTKFYLSVFSTSGPFFGIAEGDVSTFIGNNIKWNVYNSGNHGIEGDAVFAINELSINSDVELLCSSDTVAEFSTTGNVQFFSKFIKTESVWDFLNFAIENTDDSILLKDLDTGGVDVRLNSIYNDIIKSTFNLSKTITTPLTVDVLLGRIFSQIDNLENVEFFYDFTNDQLKVINTGANDIQLWYEITAVTTAVGAASNHNPFFVAFGNKTDKQTITPTSTGFLTDDGLAESDLALVAINDRYSIKGHIIFNNSEIARFEFVECIKLTATLVKLTGGFINE